MAAAYASLFQARHPRSRWVAPVWVLGMTLASTTAIARVAAGKHFWTDVIVGAAVGSADRRGDPRAAPPPRARRSLPRAVGVPTRSGSPRGRAASTARVTA
jgi:hypothetical protein